MRPAQAPTLLPAAPVRRSWIGILTSVLIHGTVVGVVLWSEAKPDFHLFPQADSVELAARRSRAVGMVYIPPPAPSRVDGRSRIPKPEPKKEEIAPTPPPPPQVAEQPTPKGNEGSPSAEDNVPADGGQAAPSVVPQGLSAPLPPTETPKRHNPSIAFRGGSYGSALGRPDPSPAWRQPPTVEGATPRCTPGPARSASDPMDWGVVAGRIYRMGTSDPLPGADLQVLGTPYHTTSDQNGDYVLRFDAWPLKNCEQQFVRVTMDGFVTQTLVLSIGVTARSDVQLRGR